MRKNTVTVLDIGSSRITAAVAERGINNTFVIKGYAAQNYAGFSEGVFFDNIEFDEAVGRCLKQVEENVKCVSDTVYVGVPGEFTTVVLREKQTAFEKTKRITEYDLADLYDSAYDLKTKKYTLINRSGIYFTLDDMRRVADPVGAVGRVLKGYLSFVLCDNNFINTVTPVLKNRGVNRIEYISSPLAEALYLFEPEYRDKTAVLLDSGYLTSSFSVIRGDAVIYQKAFPFGGGYIAFALTRDLDIAPELAEKLKKKVNLTCNTAGNYDIIDGDREYSFSVKQVNEIVLKSLDELCECIGQCIADFDMELPEYVPLSVTGGGICFMRGAKEHLSRRLNIMVETLFPPVPHMNKPTDSSLAALLDLALLQPVKKENFIKKLFK